MNVLAMSGSLRTGSWNTKLLHLVIPQLKERGVSVDEFDFKAAQVPIFDPDIHETNPPKGVVDFKTRLKAAHALLIVSPEYNYSIPGPLKNLIDVASRPPKENPFKGKLAAQMGATTGMKGTLQMQVMLRHVLSGLSMMSYPGAFTLSKAAEAFDEKGQLSDPAQQKMLATFLDGFVEELKLRER